MDPHMEPYPVYTDNNDTDSELGTNYDRYLGLNSLIKNGFLGLHYKRNGAKGSFYPYCYL